MSKSTTNGLKAANMRANLSKARISTNTDRQEKKVINDMEFVSIKDENYRVYEIPTEHGIVELEIGNPEWLFVRPSGSHLVIDKCGITHYIPNTFIHLLWENGGDVEANF